MKPERVLWAASACFTFEVRVLELEIPTSFRVSFSLVPFFWTSKRKIPATGALNKVRKCPWGAATGSAVRCGQNVWNTLGLYSMKHRRWFLSENGHHEL